MSRPHTNWLLAVLLAGVLALGSSLDGPDDIDAMQTIAANTQAVQADKLVLP